jgi:tetratricopeptide (TPR) repeat protein
MKKIIFLLLLVAIAIRGYCSPLDKWWQNANTFYSQKQYDSAAFYYEKIAALKPNNASVYFNLGNTYYRLNQVGLAVLNYERALKINPDHKEAQDNLYVTQNRINNRIINIPDIFFVRWWQSITAPVNSGKWAICALILFLLLLVTLSLKIIRKKQLPPQLIAGILIVWCLSLILAFISANNKVQTTKAVVMQTDAPFMNMPQYGKAQSLVPEGTVVNLKGEQKGWIEVKLPDGRTGWMEKFLLTKI